MKIRIIYALGTVLALAALIGAPAATAQSTDLKAKVPFAFYAAGKLFPAGTYRISQPSPGTLRIHQESGNKSAFVMTTGREKVGYSDASWIKFHQYGDLSFLAGAYWSGSSVSLGVPAPRAEQQIAKNGAKGSPITVAAR